MQEFQTIIIGAGAAGLMCAARAALKGKSVLVIDHAETIGEKIRISGGGRCNFTNLHTTANRYLSENPHFCKSALARYKPKDFIALVERYRISYHDKGQGQLFCDGKATQIVDMLLEECRKSNVTLWTGTDVREVVKTDAGFELQTGKGLVAAENLVVATGGLSIPKIGATAFGYKIAEQFGHAIIPPRAGLVPLTFTDEKLSALCADLTGISVDPVIIKTGKVQFEEALLFTHRGLSGPAILQISSYWHETQPIIVNLLPKTDALAWLKTMRKDQPKKMLRTVLEELLPHRLATAMASLSGQDGQTANLSDKKIAEVAKLLNAWTIIPAGTEGYRTAEVTLGGVDTKGLSSQTFESQTVKGLYFIGEVLDVTGHLGGFNFQWAWSSGFCCGEALG